MTFIPFVCFIALALSVFYWCTTRKSHAKLEKQGILATLRSGYAEVYDTVWIDDFNAEVKLFAKILI